MDRLWNENDSEIRIKRTIKNNNTIKKWEFNNSLRIWQSAKQKNTYLFIKIWWKKAWFRSILGAFPGLEPPQVFRRACCCCCSFAFFSRSSRSLRRRRHHLSSDDALSSSDSTGICKRFKKRRKERLFMSIFVEKNKIQQKSSTYQNLWGDRIQNSDRVVRDIAYATLICVLGGPSVPRYTLYRVPYYFVRDIAYAVEMLLGYTVLST